MDSFELSFDCLQALTKGIDSSEASKIMA